MINVSQAFHRTSANPIDESLALTKAQMLTVNDNLMPSKYLTVCQDDGKIYLYDKTNESDVETGRFRVFEGGSTVTVDPTPMQGSTNAVSSGGTYTALADKVDKVSGKQLSTEDYTTAEKTKLSGVETGAEVNTIEGITVNGDAITPDANKIAALTVLTNTVNNLLNYYTKTETYTKSEVDALVSAVSGATFVSVQTLPTTDIQTNVIYLVPKQTPETSNIKDEYINLDGTTAGWELIGDTGIDLSNYVTTTALNTALADYTTTADLTTLLSGKVDKVNGKQLSTEDYTSAEKTKLAGLSNYDDTALSGRVSDIEDVVPSTATTSNKLATMADVVSGAGGHIIEDSTGVDMTTRTNLQFVGASVTDDSTNDRTVVTVNTSDKADKVASATNGNLASLDNNGNLADSGVASSDVVTTSSTAGLLKNDGTVDTTSYVSDISGKADKVTSATSGDLAGLDANGNITDSGVASNIFPSTATSSNKLATMADVGSGGQTIQYDTMPTASSENEDDIIQYVGATTQDYTNGYFYKCVAQGTEPETYAWEAQPVQEGGGGADSRIGEEITDINVEKDNGVNRLYININPSKVYSKFGDWNSMTDFLKREVKADSSTPQTSTHTAETDEKVLAVCWSKVGSGSDNGDQPVSMTTTGEFASTPLIWKTSDSDEEYKAAGGFGLAQASLSAGESITATSGVRAAADPIFGCFYFLPMTSFATAEIVHTNAIDSHNPHNYTIPSNGHYLCVCAGFGYYTGGGTIQFNDIELNDAVIENQYASSTNTPQFAIAEFVAKQGDELEVSYTMTGHIRAACFLLKLTESSTQETKVELARKDEIGGGSTIPKLTSADIEEIKSQWNPSGGGGGGSSTHEYSTDEQVVGKWIDGSDLYEKTIHITTSVTSGATIATIDSLNEICFAQGTFKTSNGFTRIIGYNDGAQYMTVYADANAIKVIFTGVFASGQPITSIKLLVQYTKTSS